VKVGIEYYFFCLDIGDKLVLCVGCPGSSAVGHLIEDESYRPDVAFGGIRFPLEYLQGHIERSAYCGGVFDSFGGIFFSKAEVSYFDDIFAHEDIGRLDVSEY
jgi:hypothetical protein